MEPLSEYDVAIIGGGLAGLSAAILLRRKGHRVILFEKESYPFHKVCGEYISLESLPFLQQLCLPSAEWGLPVIDTLQLTSPNGRLFTTKLPLGGIGVSRYKLDHFLATTAKSEGVHVMENTRVDEVTNEENFHIQFGQQTIKARLCLGSWGKRSNLDIKWQRQFVKEAESRLNNFVGIKYHIKTSWPTNLIGLHNFENGYCGISKIEDDKYCLCYMTRADNLKRNGNNIRGMEESVLYQNPHLKKIFTSATFLDDFPVTISQISFAEKTKWERGVLMTGDTAGMITPLCGNGMSIALHTGKIASAVADEFLRKQITLPQLETMYAAQWQKQFGFRLRAGRWLQGFFGSSVRSNLFVQGFRLFPFLAKPVIRLTHGKPF